jgi:hypothetical protein
MSDRVAIVLDLENLVGFPRSGEAVSVVAGSIPRIVADRTLVGGVGWCIRSLQGSACFALAPLGIRVHGHSDPSADAADRFLIRYLESELPSSADTVVIGSGDHIFAPTAARLRRLGKKVEVAARPRSLSAALYRECLTWYPIGTDGHPAITPLRDTRLVA